MGTVMKMTRTSRRRTSEGSELDDELHDELDDEELELEDKRRLDEELRLSRTSGG